MKHHKITGGGGIRLRVVETGNSGRASNHCSLYGVCGVGSAWSRQMGAQIWLMITGSSQWICGVTVFLISLERAMRNRDCGLMTSTRSYRLWDSITRFSPVGPMDRS